MTFTNISVGWKPNLLTLNNSLNHSRFDSYAAYLKAQGLSSSTIKRKLSSLSSFQKFLIKKKILDQPSILSQIKITPPSLPKFRISLSQNRFLNRYLIAATILIILGGLGFGLYSQTILKARKNLAYSTAAVPVVPNRILSFQGRLTDSSGNPISSSTGIIFRLMNAGTGGTELYNSGTGNSQAVVPDQNGIFSVVIGQTHGGPIPASVFTENPNVYLEIIGGGETMTPRQQIATVGYALNSETLQGLPPSAGGFKNTVMVIDGSGNLNLGETSPSIISSSGNFNIVGQNMFIGTSFSSAGSITISPDTGGLIKLVAQGTGTTASGLIQATDASLNSGNLYSASILNTNRGYNFIDFNNYNVGTTQLQDRFSVSATGSVNIGSSLTVAGNIGSGGTINFTGLAVGNTGTGTTAVFIDASGNLYKNKLGALAFQDSTAGTTSTAGNGLNLIGTVFNLGGNLTQNTQIGTSSFSLIFGQGATQPLTLLSSGFVGIGTTSPNNPLDIFNTTSSQLRLSYSPTLLSTLGTDVSGNLNIATTHGTGNGIDLIAGINSGNGTNEAITLKTLKPLVPLMSYSRSLTTPHL